MSIVENRLFLPYDSIRAYATCVLFCPDTFLFFLFLFVFLQRHINPL